MPSGERRIIVSWRTAREDTLGKTPPGHKHLTSISEEEEEEDQSLSLFISSFSFIHSLPLCTRQNISEEFASFLATSGKQQQQQNQQHQRRSFTTSHQQHSLARDHQQLLPADKVK